MAEVGKFALEVKVFKWLSLTRVGLSAIRPVLSIVFPIIPRSEIGFHALKSETKLQKISGAFFTR